MKVFLDTCTWLALQIPQDINNSQAKKHFQKLKQNRALIYTNNYILMETYTRLIYDVNLHAAEKFHQNIQTTVAKKQLNILEVDQPTRETTWHILQKYSDQKLSFADATIIAHFKKYHLDQIFSFDKQFKKCNLPVKP